MGSYGTAEGARRQMKKRGSTAIANSIMMKRQVFKGSFLLVEGRDDRLFFGKFVNAAKCTIEVAEGQATVVDAVWILESRGFSGVLGVIDADFDRVEGKPARSVNIILLETHDLENLLVRSPALDQVLAELGSQQKIKKFGRDVRDTLVAAALPIGCLRLHSLRSGLNLKFQGLKYFKFVNRNSLAIDLASFIQQVLNRSRRSSHNIKDLESAIMSIKCSGYDAWQLCAGDDLVSILRLALNRGALGTKNSTEVSYEKLCQSLRLAYSDHDFITSQLIGDIRRWERRDAKFQVLK